MGDNKQTTYINVLPQTATLRDQFAMAALQGMLSHPLSTCSTSSDVQAAYAFADAMLKERDK